jgi:hypothetical protein
MGEDGKTIFLKVCGDLDKRLSRVHRYTTRTLPDAASFAFTTVENRVSTLLAEFRDAETPGLIAAKSRRREIQRNLSPLVQKWGELWRQDVDLENHILVQNLEIPQEYTGPVAKEEPSDPADLSDDEYENSESEED